MTKKQQATARNIAWRQSLLDGRVVRFLDGMMLKSYPSAAEAHDAAAAGEGSVIVLSAGQRIETENYIQRYG